MNPKSLLSALLFLAPAVAVVTQPAVAMAADGNAILAEMDKRAESFEDQRYSAKMIIFKGGKERKTIAFDMVMEGLEKQFIEFTAPGDVAGMKVLMADANTLWMYSPEFKKVRKIAAHAQNQGFLSSEFAPSDMAMAKLSNGFDGEVKGKKGKETTMVLTPKSGSTSAYSKLEIVIDASKRGVTVIRYYDGSGNLVRVQTREGWKKVNGQPFPTRIVMENKKNGNKTVIELSNIRVNQGVDEGTFSRRNLLRG
jgi:outer membrane lipoprotein-sorting protein